MRNWGLHTPAYLIRIFIFCSSHPFLQIVIRPLTNPRGSFLERVVTLKNANCHRWVQSPPNVNFWRGGHTKFVRFGGGRLQFSHALVSSKEDLEMPQMRKALQAKKRAKYAF